MGRFIRSPAVMMHKDAFAVDVPITLGRDYGGGWMGEAYSITEPFIEPGNPIEESYENPRPQAHMVRLDQPWYDDETWPMHGENFKFPIGAEMAVGQMEPLDDYRLVFDGAHA